MVLQDLLHLRQHVNNECEGDALRLHDLVVVHQLDILQLLERLILTLVKPEQQVLVTLLFLLPHLDVRQLVLEGS